MNEVSWEVIQGDCIKRMAEMDEASIDAVVCDPPYSLEFMGQAWDAHGTLLEFQAWCERWATEALRVLKPGGYLLAFGGTRTHHRLVCGVEDAGFEIRDSIVWLYGSGFPKSLDVSKAIDKANGKHLRDLAPFGAWIREAREAKGWTLRQLDEAMGTNTAASWWEGRKAGVQPPSVEMFKRLKQVLGLDDRFDELVEWAEAERAKVGERRGAQAASTGRYGGWGNDPDADGASTYDITVAATPEAKQWDGWGTALKPAHEPIVVARKPLIGTVAENVLEHGSGGINIDACRIGTSKEVPGGDQRSDADSDLVYGSYGPRTPRDLGMRSDVGRHPANVVLSHLESCNGDCAPGCPVAALDEQSGERPSRGGAAFRGRLGYQGTGANRTNGEEIGFGDSGGASRFFYCAKTSRAERNAGLEGFEEKPSLKVDPTSAMARDGRRGSGVAANDHPTVKPIALMRWLVRMVTPLGGRVLDPFLGSGSTGCAAALEDFDFIGVEREPDYIEIAKARIAFWAKHRGKEVEQILKLSGKSKRVTSEHIERGQLGLEMQSSLLDDIV